MFIKQQTPPAIRNPSAGFSLVELTIVLVIVALLSGGLMFSLSGQREQTLNKEAQQHMELVRDALLGFAMSNGRLPCPADPTLAPNGGDESLQLCTPRAHYLGSACIPADQQCAREHGAIPWRTLGLKESDPWGNRLTYFVGYEFSDPLLLNEIGRRSRFTLDTPGRSNIQDGAGNDIAIGIPAVFVSHGNRSAGAYQSNGALIAGATGNEAENANANLTFISRTPNDTFDDHVAWIIPSVLKSRMVSVGKLP